MKTKNFEQLRSDYLRDLSNQQPAAHTHPGSDNFARATALAALAEGQYQHQEWILRQVFADTADTAYLERHCAMYRIWRKAAAAAARPIPFCLPGWWPKWATLPTKPLLPAKPTAAGRRYWPVTA